MKFSHFKIFSRRNLLILIVGFFVLNNLIWWNYNKFIQGPDEGKHLFLSVLNLKRYPEQIFFNFAPFETPLYYLTADIFYKILHSTSYHVSMLNNIFYMILLLAGVSRLERIFLGTSGLLSPIFLMFIPQLAVHSRFFNPDIALCAIIAWLAYSLKKLYDEPRLLYFFMSLLFISLGSYTKISFLAFCVPLILYYLFLSLKNKQLIKVRYIFILAAMQFIVFYAFYPGIVNHLSWYGKAKVFGTQYGGGASPFVIPFKYYEKGLSGKIQEELFLILNSRLGLVMFVFFIFSIIALMVSRMKRQDKGCIITFFIGSLLVFTLGTYLYLEDRYLIPLAVFESIVIAYGVNFLFRKRIVYKSIAIVFLCLCLAQYYGISYSKRFIEHFSKFRIFNTVVNLTYYPYTSQNRIIWGLPYPDNPAERIVSIMQDNFKKGIDYKVYFLDTYISDDYTKSSFAFFLSNRVNYSPACRK
ncbi:MAG: glycosyltransferase family 39 protein [Candidatus Omnitrophica bacterium]|nr:glycosyltransferase family 39 protein [Candidatus Omnitrophota bacterium]